MIEQLIKYQQWRTGELPLDDLGLSCDEISKCIHWAIGLQAEHNALVAQVHTLQRAIDCALHAMEPCAAKSQLLYARETTPDHHLSAHDAEVSAKAVMGFAEIIRGAYSSGFSPAALTVYDVYQAARNHVFSNYETEAPIWKDEDAEQAKKGIHDIQSGAVLGAVKFCNHHMAFPVNNGSIANAVIAVDDLTNYAEHLRAKAGE